GAEQAGAWAEALPATDGDDWHLVLVDDVHLWEREWERSGPERAAVEALTVALAGRRGLAVVAASDPDDARSRQHIPGLTQALRRARRVAVVAPEMSDGSLAATTIPMHTSEPLTGPGRALLVSGGSTHVVQLIAASARTSVNGSLS
ncbi:MAG: hypothetical protein J0H73_00220, partial [Salana multivorans]|nr:hypothetical protein [Salana multivorans]